MFYKCLQVIFWRRIRNRTKQKRFWLECGLSCSNPWNCWYPYINYRHNDHFVVLWFGSVSCPFLIRLAIIFKYQAVFDTLQKRLKYFIFYCEGMVVLKQSYFCSIKHEQKNNIPAIMTTFENHIRTFVFWARERFWGFQSWQKLENWQCE